MVMHINKLIARPRQTLFNRFPVFLHVLFVNEILADSISIHIIRDLMEYLKLTIDNFVHSDRIRNYIIIQNALTILFRNDTKQITRFVHLLLRSPTLLFLLPHNFLLTLEYLIHYPDKIFELMDLRNILPNTSESISSMNKPNSGLHAFIIISLYVTNIDCIIKSVSLT